MVRTSITKYSYVLGDERIRLDSKFYRKEFVETIETLNAVKRNGVEVKPLGSKDISTTLTDGKHGYYTFVDNGIPFIRNENVKVVFLDLENIKYISHKEHKENIRSEIVHEDILLTSIGTVGNAGIFLQDKFEKANISQNLVKIRVNRKNINPYYLVIFLNSKYGRFQILRFVQGNNQPYINFPSIKKILVPLLPHDFQLHIEQLVKEAYEKRKLAGQKYQQAEELLYELLGISKEEIERLEAEKAYEVNFKEVKQAFRFDAEYYHPKYYFSDKIFKQIPSARLGSKEYFELKKGIEVGSDAYCDKNRGVLFLRVSNLSRDGLKLNPSDKYIFKGIYKKLRPKYEPKEGEVLFSKDGTIGTATVVDSDFPPSIISGGVVRIRIKKDFDPYYLAFVLNSILLELQVTREKTGTVIEHLRFSKLKEIRVPKLPLSQQQYVANPVREYFKLRKEARQLVQRAIREVEEAIENASSSNGE